MTTTFFFFFPVEDRLAMPEKSRILFRSLSLQAVIRLTDASVAVDDQVENGHFVHISGMQRMNNSLLSFLELPTSRANFFALLATL